jgi:hypothetical protein
LRRHRPDALPGSNLLTGWCRWDTVPMLFRDIIPEWRLLCTRLSRERVNVSTCQLPRVYSLFVPQSRTAAQNGSLTGILNYEGLLDVNDASAQRDSFLFFLFENECPPIYLSIFDLRSLIINSVPFGDLQSKI